MAQDEKIRVDLKKIIKIILLLIVANGGTGCVLLPRGRASGVVSPGSIITARVWVWKVPPASEAGAQ